MSHHQVFNARVKWLQKERAAADAASSREAEYVRDEVARRLVERLLDIRRTWPLALDLGAHACNVARALVRPDPDPDPGFLGPGAPQQPGPISERIGRLIAAESSPTLLWRDAELPLYRPEEEQEGAEEKKGEKLEGGKLDLVREVLASDETLPWDASTFDLVLSSLHLHWTNDLPGVLAQINHILKPDCAFVGAMLGGDTLFELRTSLQLAEQERRGGVSPHVSPLADVRDVGGLLQRAGFTMLTVDVDDLVVDYPDSFALMRDLQAMGEANAVLGREAAGLRRDVLLAADAIYRELHGNPDGTIPATFRTIYMIGWKVGGDQPKPLPRGSGQVNLKDILENK
ncbi:hypothetical protein SLS62_008970 [Diatrype stigma]|uniref:Methyltransferase type 11 domain-containing protein n=1 Tax=Diatrype stigma TaxID=117547 RepID=A0AAN9UPG0_9PEZI